MINLEHMDVIRLDNIDLYAYHGVAPEERKLGQHFLVSVELYTDLTAAAASDDLAQAIDYAAVYQTVAGAFCRQPCQLLERAAWLVLEALFADFPIAEAVVRVRKLSPPVNAVFDGAEVELLRSRAEMAGD